MHDPTQRLSSLRLATACQRPQELCSSLLTSRIPGLAASALPPCCSKPPGFHSKAQAAMLSRMQPVAYAVINGGDDPGFAKCRAPTPHSRQHNIPCTFMVHIELVPVNTPLREGRGPSLRPRLRHLVSDQQQSRNTRRISSHASPSKPTPKRTKVSGQRAPAPRRQPAFGQMQWCCFSRVVSFAPARPP